MAIHYDTMVEAINGLKRQGYEHDFNLHPEWIECAPLNLKLAPDQFHVDQVHRFEGMTNPDDSAVLYAISAQDGLKGLLVDAYGPYAETVSEAMIAKLQIDDQTER